MLLVLSIDKFEMFQDFLRLILQTRSTDYRLWDSIPSSDHTGSADHLTICYVDQKYSTVKCYHVSRTRDEFVSPFQIFKNKQLFICLCFPPCFTRSSAAILSLVVGVLNEGRLAWTEQAIIKRKAEISCFETLLDASYVSAFYTKYA